MPHLDPSPHLADRKRMKKAPKTSNPTNSPHPKRDPNQIQRPLAKPAQLTPPRRVDNAGVVSILTPSFSKTRSGYSSRTLEIKSVPMPAPVPPPNEWQSWKPCKQSQPRPAGRTILWRRGAKGAKRVRGEIEINKQMICKHI